MRKLAVKAYDTYEHSFHRTPHAVDRMLFSMKNVSALLKSFIGFPRTKLLWLARTGLLRSKTVCRIYRLCGVKIGPLSTIAPQGVYLDVEGLRHISIGRDVHISPYVSIITHAQTPPFHAPRFGRAGLKKLDRWKPRPVIIGDGAVIYTGATILPGVTVGEGAMIGAGAVVNRDVEPFTMVGGIPAKPIGSTRESTPQKIIDGIEITPFKYGLPGALCLSADFELNWAVRDRFGNTGHMTRRFLPGLLEFFEKYQTPVTWATVGHLFLDHCERPSGAAQPHADIPMKQDDWFSVDPCSNVEKEPSWYGPDLIRMIMDSSIKSPAISSAKPPAISSDKSSVKSSVMHEIGCHTFSHVDLSDEDCPSPYAPKDCSPEVANAELAKCVAVMEPFGVRPRSLVFPKNYEGNYESLVRNGFTCFRSRNVEGILHYPRKVHDLWDLPASNDFSPLLLVRNADDIDYRLRRYIDEAIACNKCAHFWFHPWFMSEKVLGLLAPTFEYIRELQDKKQLWVATMEEIAAYCEARETVDLSISSTGDAISSTGNAGSSTGNALSVQITHTIDTERYGTPSLTLRIPAELLPDSQYELTAQPSMEDVSWEERESSLFVTLSVTVQRLTITSKT